MIRLFLVVSFIFHLVIANGCSSLAGVTPVANARVAEGFCAFRFMSGLSSPRQIITASNGDILVVEVGNSQVTVIYEATPGSGTFTRARLASASGLNHAVQINGNFLYASSDTTVYRWNYTVGQRTDLGAAQVVIRNMPPGGHSTRTMTFDAQNRLYVSVGSLGNVDSDASRSNIRRYADLSTLPINWNAGELFASGLRNEVGLAWDDRGRLWGVENGRDNLNRADLGGDIYQDNPAEEVNIFETSGRFYGYPNCWTQYSLPSSGMPPGTSWADPGFMPQYNDSWCRDPAQVVRPAFSMAAHMAPLDIMFTKSRSFHSKYHGAYVAQHGSWNRAVPQGYRVDLLSVDATSGLPTSTQTVLAHDGAAARDDTRWTHRPVSMTMRTMAYGEIMLITSDSNGLIIGMAYTGVVDTANADSSVQLVASLTLSVLMALLMIVY